MTAIERIDTGEFYESNMEVRQFIITGRIRTNEIVMNYVVVQEQRAIATVPDLLSRDFYVFIGERSLPTLPITTAHQVIR